MQHHSAGGSSAVTAPHVQLAPLSGQALREYLRSKRWSAIPSNGNPNFNNTVSGISLKTTTDRPESPGHYLSSDSLWQVPADYTNIPQRDEDRHGDSDNSELRDKSAMPAACIYDVETEHAYIMAKALSSYEEHTQTSNISTRCLPKRPRAKSASCAPVCTSCSSTALNWSGNRPKIAEVKTPAQIQPIATQAPLQFGRATTPLQLTANGKKALRRLPGKKITTRPSTSLALRLQKTNKSGRPVSANSNVSRNGVAREAVDIIREVSNANGALREGRGRGRQALTTARILGTSPSMDQLGTKPAANDTASSARRKFDGTFFAATNSPRRAYYTIHPEWISENLSVQKLTLKERTATFPPRRCKSAPPTITRPRNPITWENWNVKPHR